MISNILLLIPLCFGVFIPIVIWSYIFTTVGGGFLYKKLFMIGIISGMIAIVPILYLDNFLSFIGASSLSIFGILHNLGGVSSYVYFLVSISLFLFILLGIWGIYNMRHLSKTLRVFSGFLVFTVLFLILVFSVQLFFAIFPNFDVFFSQGVYFKQYIFNSLQLIILYYLVIAFLEESSKYFSFSGAFADKQDLHTYTIGVVFVALGFAFLENILYVYSFYEQSGFSKDLIKLGIFRGIFSTILHVLCSLVIFRGFFKIGNIFGSSIASVGSFLGFLCLGIILHSMYDVFLSAGFTVVVFLYLIGGYLYIGGTLYHQKFSKNLAGEDIG